MTLVIISTSNSSIDPSRVPSSTASMTASSSGSGPCQACCSAGDKSRSNSRVAGMKSRYCAKASMESLWARWEGWRWARILGATRAKPACTTARRAIANTTPPARDERAMPSSSPTVVAASAADANMRMVEPIRALTQNLNLFSKRTSNRAVDLSGACPISAREDRESSSAALSAKTSSALARVSTTIRASPAQLTGSKKDRLLIAWH